MDANKNDGKDEPMNIPQWKPGAMKAIYEEALRATREIDPHAERPMNAIFSGMVSALYRPAPVQMVPVRDMVPGKILPIHDFVARRSH